MATESWQALEYELAGRLRFVDRLSVPHRIAYTADRSVVIDQAGAGEPRRLLEREGRFVACRLAFDPDGKRIYHSAAQILEIDLETRNTRALTSFAPEEHYAAAWDLFTSPDGSSLYFLHMTKEPGGNTWRSKVCAMDIDGRHLRTVFESGEHGHAWHVSLDLATGTLVVVTTRPRKIFSLDLDGGNLREAPAPEYGTASYGSDRLDLAHGGVVHVRRRNPSLESFEPHGKGPSLSPDGGAVAFMRDDHEVWLSRFAAPEAECLVRARGRSESHPADWACAPAWSRDGRLLWFSSTTGTFMPELLRPGSVDPLRQERGETSNAFKRSLELDHWRYAHRVGIVDFERNEVWMAQGRWRDVAWAP